MGLLRKAKEKWISLRAAVARILGKWKAAAEKKIIYLTFDDGPGPYTSRLLDVLDRYRVKATFFVVGNEYEDMLKQITERGHSIGIHSVCHDYDKVYQSPEAFFEDLTAMEELIFRNTGVRTKLMRFPGGSSNTISRRYCPGIMTHLTQAVEERGYRYFDWNVDSDDAGKTKTTEGVAANIKAGILNRKTSLVLQHDIQGFSVDAVEQILRWGRRRGYVFLPLTQDSPGFHHQIAN